MKRKKIVCECSVWLLLVLNSFLYISSALYSPFLSTYYTQNGISSTQIGILMAIGPIASVLVQPLWARVNDDSGRAKNLCHAGHGRNGCFPDELLPRTQFYQLSVFSTLLALFSTSVSPMTDVIVIRNANRCDYNFAFIRMGGTVGYAVIVLIAGIYLRQNPSSQFSLSAVPP